MRCKWFSALAAAVVAAWGFAEEATVGAFTYEYELDEAGATITWVNPASETATLPATWTIPEKLGGEPVRQMVAQCLGWSRSWLKVTKVVFPATFERVRFEDEWTRDFFNSDFFWDWETDAARSALTLEFKGPPPEGFQMNSWYNYMTGRTFFAKALYPTSGTAKTAWETLLDSEVLPVMDKYYGGVRWNGMVLTQYKPKLSPKVAEAEAAIRAAAKADGSESAKALGEALCTIIDLNTNTSVRSALATFGLSVSSDVLSYDGKEYIDYTYQPNAAAELILSSAIYSKVKSAITQLGQVSVEWDGFLTVTTEDLPLLSEDLTLDAADAKTLKAMLEGVCAGAQLARSYDLKWNYKLDYVKSITIPTMTANTEAAWAKIPKMTLEGSFADDVCVQVGKLGTDLLVRITNSGLADWQSLDFGVYDGPSIWVSRSGEDAFSAELWTMTSWQEFSGDIVKTTTDEGLVVSTLVLSGGAKTKPGTICSMTYGDDYGDYYWDGRKSAEEMIAEQPNFAKARRTGANLTEGKTWAKQAFMSAADALTLIADRTHDRVCLFNLPESMTFEEVEARIAQARDLVEAVDRPTFVTDFERVDLSVLFSMEGPTYAELPPVDDLGMFDLDAAPDRSFAGVLPDRDFGKVAVSVTCDDMVGSVSGAPAKAVKDGGKVTLKATPAKLCTFSHWALGDDDLPLELEGESYTITSGSATTPTITLQVSCPADVPVRELALRAVFIAPPRLAIDTSGEGTATGDGVYKVGTKVTLKATPAKGWVFAGWYLDGVPLEGSVDYRTQSFAYVTGEEDCIIEADFVPASEDETISFGEMCTEFEAGEEVEETVEVVSASLPKLTVSGLPTGLKFDAKTLKITGKPTKPGYYTVTFKATNATVKKASEETTLALDMRVANFTDSLLPLLDSYGEYTLIVPGVAQEIPLGDEAIGWSASGLPTGMKFDAKTGTFTGTPTKPGRYTVIFTKKIDKETHTVSTTVIVADFPELDVIAQTYDAIAPAAVGGTATGSGAYAANKGVRLAAKPAKGYVFGGWCDAEGNALEGLTVDYRTASVTWPMAESDTTVYADFYPAEMDAVISSILLSDGGETYGPENELGIEAGEPVEVAVEVSSISLPKIAVKGLPTGLKFDAKTNKITGKATTPGLYELTVSVTNTTIKTADTYSTAIFRLRVANYVDEEIPLPDALTPVKPNLTIEPTILEDALGCTVKGLPTGVKWDAKTGTLSGKPTKPGYYTLIFSKKIGKETHTASTLFEVLPFPRLTISGEMVEGTLRGTVKGAGNYPAGTKVKLTATPKAGYVFAGWEPLEQEEGSSTYVDPRTPSITYIMGEEDATLTAKFVSAAEDAESIATTCFGLAGEVEGTLTIDPSLAEAIAIVEQSCSLPKVAFKGLPTGLKYDAKANKITGKATKPGIYTVTMALTNASVKTATAATTRTLTFTVLNLNDLGLEDVATPVTIPAGGTEHSDGRLPSLIGASASGLPTGLKWDAKTGTLSGVAWKVGDYTVTFTKGKLKATLTFTVEAEPPAIELFLEEASEWFAGLVGEPYLIEGRLMVSSSPTTELRPKVTLRGLPSGCKSKLTDIGEGYYAVSLSGNFPTAAARYLVEFVATDAKTGLEVVTPLTLRAYDEASLWGDWAEDEHGTIYGTALAYGETEGGVWHATISQANAKGSATLQLTGYSALSLKLVESSLQDGGIIRTYQTVKGKERFTLVHWSGSNLVYLTIEIWDSEVDDYVVVDAVESYGASWIKPLTVCEEFPLAAKTYTITGEVCGEWDEGVLISPLSGSLTLKATGEATAKLTTTNPKASFSLTGGVLDDGRILLIGRSPSGFVDAGEPMIIDLVPGWFELRAGAVWAGGNLTEGPFPSME